MLSEDEEATVAHVQRSLGVAVRAAEAARRRRSEEAEGRQRGSTGARLCLSCPRDLSAATVFAAEAPARR